MTSDTSPQGPVRVSSDRKNIFLIGRRAADEDQLTEMLAFLWQEMPEALHAWLRHIGLPTGTRASEVETQFTIPSGKRPDIVIRSDEGTTIVESKLGSGFGEDQVRSYLRYLSDKSGRCALVLLTQMAEPVQQTDQALADQLNVQLIPERWHAMAQYLGETGEESLAGDFIKLLIREGLVKPEPLRESDWETWNAGYNVALRLDALLNELDPHVTSLLPGAKGRSNATKFWTWRLWNSGAIDVGLAFLAAEWTDRPRTEPRVHAWVLNREADDARALRAVDVDPENRSKWTESAQVKGAYGLNPYGPAISRPASDVLGGESFDDQVRSACSFLRETVEYYTTRGYLPRVIGSGTS